MWLNIRLVLLAVVVIPILDYLWLGLVMKDFYLGELGSLARTVDGQFKPQITAAFFVYLFLALGLVIFVRPQSETFAQALGFSALFGLLVYGVYDMTNLSTLQGYSVRLALLDTAWGATVCGLTGVILFFVGEWING